jgi:hypothetical protein
METETTTQNHGAAQALYLTTAEEDEVAEEVNDAAKDCEVKTNYPR